LQPYIKEVRHNSKYKIKVKSMDEYRDKRELNQENLQKTRKRHEPESTHRVTSEFFRSCAMCGRASHLPGYLKDGQNNLINLPN